MLRRDPRKTNRTPDRKSRNMEYARNITIRAKRITRYIPDITECPVNKPASSGASRAASNKPPTARTLTVQDAMKDSNVIAGEFDIILEMDWLTSNDAQIDCKVKKVKLNVPGKKGVIFRGKR
ncbi:hypothetical protein AgCh_032664 [Apium graveolens]